MMESPRQTLGYLQNLLARNRLFPKNKLGQNFLIDLNLMDLVIQNADLSRADLVLEVGTGTASLTNRLAALAGSVLSVEVDHAFYELARDVVGSMRHVHLVWSDILKNKNTLHPTVLAKLQEVREMMKPERIKLVANLPYAIATPLISNLLIGEIPVERMVVMVQWEIAEKLTAKPSTSTYSALGVFVQNLADVEILRRLAPSVFWPKPKVDSAIVRIRPNAEKRKKVPNPQGLRIFLRDLYSHRRKNLRGALVAMAGRDYEKAFVDSKLAELGFDGGARAEDLDLDQHLRLRDAFEAPHPTPTSHEEVEEVDF